MADRNSRLFGPDKGERGGRRSVRVWSGEPKPPDRSGPDRKASPGPHRTGGPRTVGRGLGRAGADPGAAAAGHRCGDRTGRLGARGCPARSGPMGRGPQQPPHNKSGGDRPEHKQRRLASREVLGIGEELVPTPVSQSARKPLYLLRRLLNVTGDHPILRAVERFACVAQCVSDP